MCNQFIQEKMNMLNQKDNVTYEHSLRMGRLAKNIASSLHLDDLQTNQLITGCCLHDIGKIDISDPILHKTDALDPLEWELMKQHPRIGINILMECPHIDREILDIVAYHHERWDGKGYPYRLSGNDIPILARICAIIDSFDCMLNDRPYRKKLSLDDAKRELWLNRNKQFDTKYVDVFLSLPDEALGMHETMILRSGG